METIYPILFYRDLPPTRQPTTPCITQPWQITMPPPFQLSQPFKWLYDSIPLRVPAITPKIKAPAPLSHIIQIYQVSTLTSKDKRRGRVMKALYMNSTLPARTKNSIHLRISSPNQITRHLLLPHLGTKPFKILSPHWMATDRLLPLGKVITITAGAVG